MGLQPHTPIGPKRVHVPLLHSGPRVQGCPTVPLEQKPADMTAPTPTHWWVAGH